MLTDLRPQRALSLVNGDLAFVELDFVAKKPPSLGCCFWQCVEKNGWLGFRNTASGAYLGTLAGEESDDEEEEEKDRDDVKNSKSSQDCDSVEDRALTAVRKVHGSTERFCVRHVGNGGYILLTMLHESGGLHRIACRPNLARRSIEFGVFSRGPTTEFRFVEF